MVLPPPGFAPPQQQSFMNTFSERRIIEEEEDAEDEEEEDYQIHVAHTSNAPRLTSTHSHGNSIPRNVNIIVNSKDDEVSVVSFLSEHTATTITCNQQHQYTTPTLEPKTKSMAAQDGNIHSHKKSVSQSSFNLGQQAEDKDNHHEDAMLPNTAPHQEKHMDCSASKENTNSSTMLREKKKKKKKKAAAHEEKDNFHNASSSTKEDENDTSTTTTATKHTSSSQHHLKSNEHHSEHQTLNCSYYSTSSPIRDRTISENSSISTPKSPIKHYSSAGKRSSNKHRTSSSNNKERCSKTKTSQYRSQVTVTTSWQDKLRSAIFSFLLLLWTHAIHLLKTTRRNILYTKPREKILGFIHKICDQIRKVFFQIARFFLFSIETLVHFIILLHKLAMKEVVRNQVGFFYYSFCTSFPQISNYITTDVLISPHWFPQLIWICIVVLLCCVQTKPKAKTPISCCQKDAPLDNYESRKRDGSNINSTRNNTMATRQNRETEQIIVSILNGRKNGAKSKGSSSPLLTDSIASNHMFVADDAAIAKLSPSLRAALLSDFNEETTTDYHLFQDTSSAYTCYYLISKLPKKILRSFCFLLVILWAFDTVSNDSSSLGVILELTGSEQVLLGFTLAVIKLGYSCSPIAWISWSVQIFIITLFHNLIGQQNHIFLLEHFLMTFGMATLHLIHKFSIDRHAAVNALAEEREQAKGGKSKSIQKTAGATATSQYQTETKGVWAFLRILAIVVMELAKIILPI